MAELTAKAHQASICEALAKYRVGEPLDIVAGLVPVTLHPNYTVCMAQPEQEILKLQQTCKGQSQIPRVIVAPDMPWQAQVMGPPKIENIWDIASIEHYPKYQASRVKAQKDAPLLTRYQVVTDGEFCLRDNFQKIQQAKPAAAKTR